MTRKLGTFTLRHAVEHFGGRAHYSWSIHEDGELVRAGFEVSRPARRVAIRLAAQDLGWRSCTLLDGNGVSV